MSEAKRKFLACSCLVAVLSLGVISCGGSDDDAGASGDGEAVTVYSSLPLQGDSRPTGLAIQNGIELAFDQAGDRAGDVRVDYEPLDDATAKAGQWTAKAEAANARKAADDDSAVAYIGTYNSGAAAISIPILNKAGMAMLSPGNTAVGLTSDQPGADIEKGEPGIYYPTGKRNYARIVPKDTVQGAAIARLMDQDGCRTVGLLDDGEVYGKGLATNVAEAGKAYGYDIVDGGTVDTEASSHRKQARSLAGKGVDCFFYGAITASDAVRVFEDVAAAIPGAKLYGPDGVADSDFAGGLPEDVAADTKVTVATLSEHDYGADGAAFYKAYRAKYGTAEPYAIYGYEAGKLILDVLERAKDPADRASVVDALFATKDRDSILGRYSIDRNGDTTLTDYGVYTIDGDGFKFDEKLQAG